MSPKHPILSIARLCLLSLTALPALASAQEELVDTSWGDNGRFHSSGAFMQGGDVWGLKLGRISQGQIVEAANAQNEILLRRLDTGLQPDSAFGEDGLVSLRSTEGGFLNGLQLAVVPSGTNLDSTVVAVHRQFNSDCLVGRVQADGRIASAYGRLGLRRPSLPGSAPRCRDLAVDADSIYLLFSHGEGNSARLGVAKFDHDLNPRLEFGSQGAMHFEQSFGNRPSRLSVSGGRIVVGASPIQLQLFQLMADTGQPDLSFGSNGVWTPPQFQELATHVWDVQHQAQNIVVLYAGGSGSDRAARLRKFSPTGQPMLSFGNPSSGVCTLVPGGLAPFEEFEGTLAQDGASLKVLVAMEASLSPPLPRVFGTDAASCQSTGPFATGIDLIEGSAQVVDPRPGDLLSVGTNLLATYSKTVYEPAPPVTGGRVLTTGGSAAAGLNYPPLPRRARSANGVLDAGLQDGRLVFVGTGNFFTGYATAADAAGAQLLSFGSNGSIALPINIGVHWLSSAGHVGPTSTVFAATAYAVTDQRGLDEPLAPFFYKLDAHGQPVSGFGDNGKAQPSTGSDGTDIRAVTQDGDRVVALGRDSYYGPKFAVLYRLLANGEIDPSFGSAGATRFAGGVRASDELHVVATTANRVFTAGLVEGSPRIVLYVFDQNGVPVNVGNPEGRIELSVAGIASGGWQLDLREDDDGVLLSAFVANGSNNSDLKLWRFLANGSLDPAFGVAGVSTIPAGSILGARPWLGHDADRILVAFSSAPAGSAPATARFKPTLLVLDASGALDPSVGNGGRYEVDLDPGFGSSAARPVASPERFVLSGRSLGDNAAVALRKQQGPLIFNNGFE
jgi:hypothetical protein